MGAPRLRARGVVEIAKQHDFHFALQTPFGVCNAKKSSLAVHGSILDLASLCPGLYVVEVAKAQRFRASHRPIQHERGLLQLVGRRVHGDREQVEVALDVVPVEAGVRPQEALQQEAQAVDRLQRVELVREALEQLGVVGLALEGEPVHQHRVGVLHIVQQRRARLDVGSEAVPGLGLVRLAEALVDEQVVAGCIRPDADAELVPGQAPRQLAVRLAHGVLLGHRVEGLVDPDPAAEEDVVLHPLQHLEDLGHPVRRRGVRAPVLPGHRGDALEGNRLQDEVDPRRDRQLRVVEDGAGDGRGRPAAGHAAVDLDPVAVGAVALDPGRAAVRALAPGVAVEEVGVAGEALVAERVDAVVGRLRDGLGGRDLAFGQVVPRRGGRGPSVLLSAHGCGSPYCLGGWRHHGTSTSREHRHPPRHSRG